MRKLIYNVLSICVVLLLSNGCQKDSTGPDNSSSVGNLTVRGKVLDESGNPVSAAKVISGSQNTTTASDGSFTLTKVSSKNSIVNIEGSKDSYFTNYQNIADPDADGSELYTELKLLNKQSLGSIAAGGGTISSIDNNFSVEAPSNGFTKTDGSPFTGQVNVSYRYVKADEIDLLSSSMPGGDFAADDSTGSPGTLQSFGFFATEFTDAFGNLLNPSSSVMYKAKIPTTAGSLSNIRKWTFDTRTKRWKDGGKLTPVDNEVYVPASIERFCNLDRFSQSAVIKGSVKCSTQALPPNTPVILSKPGVVTYKTFTNKNGKFSFRNVLANETFDLYVGGVSTTAASGNPNSETIIPTQTINCDVNPPQQSYGSVTYKGKTYNLNGRYYTPPEPNRDCNNQNQAFVFYSFIKDGKSCTINMLQLKVGLSAGSNIQMHFCGEQAPYCTTEFTLDEMNDVDFLPVSGSMKIKNNDSKTLEFSFQVIDNCQNPTYSPFEVSGYATLP